MLKYENKFNYEIIVYQKLFMEEWQKKESARAGMRRIVKRLLKKYKYPPENEQDALETVIKQCEQWTDNVE